MDLKRSVEELSHGTHISSIYGDKAEQFSLLIPFFVSALKRNEKCLCIIDESTKEEIFRAAKKAGLSIEKCVGWGQFIFLTKEETYLKDGYFTPGKTIELFIKAEQRALLEGFSGLVNVSEMTWIFAGFPGSDKLIEYESKLNYFFPHSKTVAICQYHESRFSKEVLADVIHTHPSVFIRGLLLDNPFYEPPDIFSRHQGKRPAEHTYDFIKSELLKDT